MSERTNVYDEERSDGSFAVSDELVQTVDQKKIVKDGASRFQNFHVNV
jgi:hypothetical protein